MANDISTFSYYNDTPSRAAAAVFAIVFLLTSLFHIFQLIKLRTWYFVPVVIGGLMECIGYVARVVSSKQSSNWTLRPYIIQEILILVAPALISGSIYMILGRLIIAVDGEKYSLIKKRWMMKNKAGLLTTDNGAHVTTGKNIVLIGLFIQIIAFGLFVCTALLFNKRIYAAPTYKSTQPNMPWQKHMKVLYFASGLIMVRSIVRVVEYIQGMTGYILSHEYFFYIFDATLMFTAIAVFNFIHPSQMIPGRKRVLDRQISLEQL